MRRPYRPYWKKNFWTALRRGFHNVQHSTLQQSGSEGMHDAFVVLDFETTGMSPETGARVTEIGLVRVRNGQITASYQSLMNAGVRIPRFIAAFTGISNAMIKRARPVELVMHEAAEFIGDDPLVAHNASFDRKFLDAELGRIECHRCFDFTCTLLLSRRIYPQAPNHQLGTLARFLDLPRTGRAHRALADAEMTAALMLAIHQEIRERFALTGVPQALLREIQRAPKHRYQRSVDQFRQRHGI